LDQPDHMTGARVGVFVHTAARINKQKVTRFLILGSTEGVYLENKCWQKPS
jgi:hypothetical protein